MAYYPMFHIKILIMTNLLYYVALILILFWALGFFVYNIGALIHILLLLAVVSILLRIINGKNVMK
ncbi:MAG: hypothetical protein CFE24_00760 [Flavobacterium sp. BFFFF2]|nr:MAG: hypothetical protein CFE24_00760 [Flavobacterium sp. BFFFF2]